MLCKRCLNLGFALFISSSCSVIAFIPVDMRQRSSIVAPNNIYSSSSSSSTIKTSRITQKDQNLRQVCSNQHQRNNHLTSNKKQTSTQSTSSELHVVNINSQAIFNDLDSIYTDAYKTIKCPFFRRRAADLIDNIAMILKFLIIRHKSILNDNIHIPLLTTTTTTELLEVPGCKGIGIRNPDGTVCKDKHLSLEEIRCIIESDWSVTNQKGYYITGKLTSTIYRDDCLFDGPDPDMPVRGLRKYLAAASHLFEAKNSFAKLHKLQIVEDDEEEGHGGGKFGHGVIVAHWKLGGVLMLPWRPKVKPWSGWTKYHLDEDGLIAYHEEGWDISALEAFIGTLFPEIGDRIWERDVDLDEC